LTVCQIAIVGRHVGSHRVRGVWVGPLFIGMDGRLVFRGLDSLID
jgi:hypothetical protein